MNSTIKFLWIIGVWMYGVLDLATTYYGILWLDLQEANAIPAYILHEFNILAFIPLKIVLLFGFWQIYKYLPTPYNYPIPVLLAWFGSYAVATNIQVMGIV